MKKRRDFQSADEVSAAAEKRMGKTLAPEVWDYLESKYYIEEVINGERTLDKLIEAVQEFLEAASYADVQRTRGRKLPDQHGVFDYRVLLVSNELAKSAALQPYVGRFRKLHLPAGIVLPREIAGSWIRRHWQESLHLWTVLVVDLDFHAVMRPEDDKQARIDDAVIRKALMAEEAGDADAVARILGNDVLIGNPIRLLEWPDTEPNLDDLEAGSALRDLMQSADFLNQSYGWRKHQAIWFVLTGETPLLPMLMYDIRFPQTSQDRLRITLDIDIETSPDAVMSLYRDLRNGLLHSERRPLSRKMLAMALFVDSALENTWAERMRQWNDYCKQYGRSKWAYTETSNMARDYQTRTIKRLQPQYDFDSLERLTEASWSFHPE